MEKRIRKKISPSLKIIFTLLIVIFAGSGVLILPISLKDGISISYIDSLFTSFSAVCISGISVVGNISDTFSVFGIIFLMLLMEVGAFGFTTIFLFLLFFFGAKFGIADTYLLQDSLNQYSLKGISGLVKIMFVFTLAIEILGTLLYCLVFANYFPNDYFLISLFQAISSFTNTGFTLLPNGFNVEVLATNIGYNILTCVLVILGGLGFVVILDVFKLPKTKRLSLHSKIVLLTSVLLLIFGTILIELGNTDYTFMQSAFLSVNARSSGLATVDLATASNSTRIVLIILMFIGASPVGFGGGIKTTTFFIFIITIFSFATNRQPNIFYRRIAKNSIIKAYTIAVMGIIIITISMLIVSFAEKDFSTGDGLFNAISCFSNAGIIIKSIDGANWVSKICYSLLMFVGRIGPITIVSALNRDNSKRNNIEYVEEKVVIG